MITSSYFFFLYFVFSIYFLVFVFCSVLSVFLSFSESGVRARLGHGRGCIFCVGFLLLLILRSARTWRSLYIFCVRCLSFWFPSFLFSYFIICARSGHGGGERGDWLEACARRCPPPPDHLPHALRGEIFSDEIAKSSALARLVLQCTQTKI